MKLDLRKKVIYFTASTLVFLLFAIPFSLGAWFGWELADSLLK